MSFFELCQWIQNSQIGTGIRESGYVFPFLEGTHVIGLSLSVGTIMWFDLRLLGVMFRTETVSDVFDSIKPWMLAGFTIMFTSGALLFSSIAAEAYVNVWFRIKMLLLVLAGLNVLLFHLTIGRHTAIWNNSSAPPAGARLAGFVSLILWMSVIVMGRLFAYAI